MALLRFALTVLREVGRTLAYGWLTYLVRQLKLFLALIAALWKRRHQSHSGKLEASNPCGPFTPPAYHRPDPCIYAQYYLMARGLAVTWDNPDITLWLNGVQVTEQNLQPSTTYEIRAAIWNNSFYAPVAGMKVDFAFLSFGAATAVTPIGSTFVDLGVKGGPQCPALARIPWTTPPTAGHFCLQVSFAWIDDAIPGNNLGQNNVDVAEAHSPAHFAFAVRNPTTKPGRAHFQVDTYSIPPQPQCPPAAPATPITSAERLRQARARHNRAAFPVPPGWIVDIMPVEPALQPGQQVDVAVDITPPAGFAGSQPFNIHAFIGNTYAGGVTLYVTKA